jgi:AcrR family transcriptional regulator
VPIWARREPGSRRPRFTRDQIAAAALDIADREGFDAVTMRRVASELDAGTMTVYHYVRTKSDLVALMDDALMAEALVPPSELPDDWREALAAVARRTRAALMRHPWAVASLQDAQFGPNAMRHFEQSLAAVADAQLDTASKFAILGVIDDYVVGNVLHASEARRRSDSVKTDPEAAGAMVEFGLAQLRTGEFPHTEALFGGAPPERVLDDPPGPAMEDKSLDDQFEQGLQAVLDGVALRMGMRQTAPTRRRDDSHA